MSLQKYLEKKELVEKLQRELEKLENSEAVKKDKAFFDDVQELLKKHDRDERDLVKMFSEKAKSVKTKAAGDTYLCPETGKTWISGGRGKRPGWIKLAEEQGTLESLKVA